MVWDHEEAPSHFSGLGTHSCSRPDGQSSQTKFRNPRAFSSAVANRGAKLLARLLRQRPPWALREQSALNQFSLAMTNNKILSLLSELQQTAEEMGESSLSQEIAELVQNHHQRLNGRAAISMTIYQEIYEEQCSCH